MRTVLLSDLGTCHLFFSTSYSPPPFSYLNATINDPIRRQKPKPAHCVHLVWFELMAQDYFDRSQNE
ncbi:hypothetical protein VNO77_07248 [Canavalia gladiata]|uniref:Uncharacterized protein n=1 Tax=Canavalia gladiata TaxID=3824 RepID=A0AAN9R0H6_CANGL